MTEREQVVEYLRGMASEAGRNMSGIGRSLAVPLLNTAADQIANGAHLPDGWMRVTQVKPGIKERVGDAVLDLLSVFGFVGGDAADSLVALTSALRRLTVPTIERLAAAARAQLGPASKPRVEA